MFLFKKKAEPIYVLIHFLSSFNWENLITLRITCLIVSYRETSMQCSGTEKESCFFCLFSLPHMITLFLRDFTGVLNHATFSLVGLSNKIFWLSLSHSKYVHIEFQSPYFSFHVLSCFFVFFVSPRKG